VSKVCVEVAEGESYIEGKVWVVDITDGASSQFKSRIEAAAMQAPNAQNT
jgi:hypothetical protein